MNLHQHTEKLRRNRKAVSPAISSIILTSAVIVMVLVTMLFSNNFLQSTLSENEYRANKQFMQTTALQIDDVAWTIGRTQTSVFSSRYGLVNFEPTVLTYTFEVKAGSSNWVTIGNWSTGVIMFSIPASIYSLGSGYFERVFPAEGTFLQNGSTAPVSQVFVTQKTPMPKGNSLRVVAAPTIRVLNSTILAGSQTQNYIKFYLPLLSNGSNLYLSQSITLAGTNIVKVAQTGVTQVRINASIPTAAQALGYDLDNLSSTSSFFRFQSLSTTYVAPAPSTVELYLSTVKVSLGLST
jgi:hypothetical protein